MHGTRASFSALHPASCTLHPTLPRPPQHDLRNPRSSISPANTCCSLELKTRKQGRRGETIVPVGAGHLLPIYLTRQLYRSSRQCSPRALDDWLWYCAVFECLPTSSRTSILILILAMELPPLTGPPTYGPAACPHCSQVFSRKEHLDRHLHRHSGTRSFRCSVCNKSFSRRDTLARHQIVHGSFRSPEASRRQSLAPHRGCQACQECAKAKSRCHGGQPCHRCVRRGLSCQFEPRSRPLKVTPLVSTTTSMDESVLGPRTAVSNVINETQQANTQLNMDLPSLELPLPPASPNLHYRASLSLPSNASTANVTAVQNDLPPSESHFMVATPGSVLGDCSLWQADDLYSLDPIFWGFDEVNSTDNQMEVTAFTGRSFSPAATRTTSCFNAIPSPRPSEHGLDANTTEPGLNENNAALRPTSNTYTPLHFPPPSPEDYDVIQKEDSGHVHSISPPAYHKLRSFLNDNIDPRSSHIPSIEFFHSFVQLYFEYFDTLFPFIHPSVMGEDGLSWLLLLAVSSIGCQYSGVKHGTDISNVLHEMLKLAIRHEMPDPLQTASLDFVQSMFLRDARMIFSGLNRQQLKVQFERNTLVTLCRSIAQTSAARETPLRHGRDSQVKYRDWQSWLSSESMTRLMYSVFGLDCLQMVLFDLYPMCNMRDLAMCNSTDDKLWDCLEASSWEAEFGSRKDQSELSRQNPQTLPSSVTQSVPTLALYAQEKFILDNLNILSRPSSSLPPKLTSSLPIPVPSLQQLATPFSTAVDNELHISRFASKTEPLFHIISILRRVPLRRLYSFSGWQTNAAEIEESEKSLESWMQGNEEAARECLWHAAVGFSTLRSQSYISCHAPLCMLVAAIYIWAYDKLSHYNVLKADTITRTNTVRLDSLQDPTRVEKWIKGESGSSRIYIREVGILNGSESISRLLLELERSLLGQTAWPGLCGGIAFAIRGIINGGLPLRQPE
ncbi:hypothetical protein ONS95_002642 [Cadophora gregata]|uniref:uncharacterized protein n=1 Tax=Cadophora gregata TaxID=51156 RepID=UPI0026DAA7DB|nr:uncharacterized protein ONS95_002642 [Cadophora gregata]KAK0109975.1 hypothetical protein ONS95_002642 [Cadophora gregata]